MSEPPAWERYLRLNFPGYLLPDAARRSLSEEAARRFLEGLGARPDELEILLGASLFAAHADAIDAFVRTHLPTLARSLPLRTTLAPSSWEGRAPGRLDVPATLRDHLQGRTTRFTVHAAQRRCDRPENLFVKAVARRLLTITRALLRSAQIGRVGWGAAAVAWAAALERALATGALTEVPDAPITAHRERCARAAAHPTYASAVAVHRAITEGLDDRSPQRLARVVAEGALLPRDDATRFELAVLVRLLEALAERLEPAGFTLHRTLIAPGRREIASFSRGDHHLRVRYNQACLDPGPYDASLRRYLGQTGRLRPDLTLILDVPPGTPRAVVIEAKLSADPAYLAEGLREAWIYRAEYAAHLRGWPQAILVASSPLPGEPRRDDAVVAVGWDRWVPGAVLDGLLESLTAAPGAVLR